MGTNDDTSGLVIDWDNLILYLLSVEDLTTINNNDQELEWFENLAQKIVNLAVDDAKREKPQYGTEEAHNINVNDVCPTCFLIYELTDPECIWGQIIEKWIHPDRLKRWAEDNGIHWCEKGDNNG